MRADAGVRDGHARHLQLHDRAAKWPQLTEDEAAPNTAAPKPSTGGKLQSVMAKQRGVVEPGPVKQDEAVGEPKDKVAPPSLLATQATAESHRDEQQSLTEEPVVADEGEEEAGTMCSITETDALSCLQRAKTEECRALIRNATCLQMEGKLYDLHIPYECPLGKSYMGQRLEAIGASEEGPPVRIAYVLTVHGRAVRQLKMLLKAIYHRDNFYYIHVDIVGICTHMHRTCTTTTCSVDKVGSVLVCVRACCVRACVCACVCCVRTCVCVCACVCVLCVHVCVCVCVAELTT